MGSPLTDLEKKMVALGFEMDSQGMLYWNMNIPMQIWESNKTPNKFRIVNYMPRKETCGEFDLVMDGPELKKFCHNTANVLRILADKFEKFSDSVPEGGDKRHIYYPV